MVEIKKTSIEDFLVPTEGMHIDKVFLFVVSPKNQRLTKLNLEHLTAEERSAKLKKWSQDNRFVAVIEIGDRMFAHAHSKHAEQLEKLDSLDGKKVTFKALTDQESEQLSAIAETFEEHVLQELQEEELQGEKKAEKEEGKESLSSLSMPRQYLASKRLVSDQVHTHFLIEQMVKRNLSKIITKSLEQYNEAQREEQKRKDADDKYFDIKRNEIKKSILREELKKVEIKEQGQISVDVRADIR